MRYVPSLSPERTDKPFLEGYFLRLRYCGCYILRDVHDKEEMDSIKSRWNNEDPWLANVCDQMLGRGLRHDLH